MRPSLRKPVEAQSQAGVTSGLETRVFVLDLLCIVPYYTGHLCKALERAGVRVDLGSITYHLDPGYFSSQGIKNHPGAFDLVSRLKLPGFIRRPLKLAECALNMIVLTARFTVYRPQVLHVQFIPLVEHGLTLELWFLRYVRMLGIRLVYTVHNLLPQDDGERCRPIFRRVYGLMEALICHNEETRAALVREFGVDHRRIAVIPHGPLFRESGSMTAESARLRLGIPADECLVLWQGFIKPYKGVPFLLDAWKRVHSRGLRARLVIAGMGEEGQLAEVREIVRLAGMESTVILDLRFLSVDEMTALYKAADIVTYPYREITTSGALMTGIHYGKAMVATALPPFLELLRDGETARFIPYGDADAFGGALIELIENESERRRLSANISNLEYEGSSWDPIARDTLTCYRGLLDGGRDTHARQAV